MTPCAPGGAIAPCTMSLWWLPVDMHYTLHAVPRHHNRSRLTRQDCRRVQPCDAAAFEIQPPRLQQLNKLFRWQSMTGQPGSLQVLLYSCSCMPVMLMRRTVTCRLLATLFLYCLAGDFKELQVCREAWFEVLLCVSVGRHQCGAHFSRGHPARWGRCTAGCFPAPPPSGAAQEPSADRKLRLKACHAVHSKAVQPDGSLHNT